MDPYIPHVLPLERLDYHLLLGLVGRANAELARYDGSLRAIPNPEIMLSPMTLREAELSSRIEGTQATLSEVLEHEAGAIKLGERATIFKRLSTIGQLWWWAVRTCGRGVQSPST